MADRDGERAELESRMLLREVKVSILKIMFAIGRGRKEEENGRRGRTEVRFLNTACRIQ